MPQIVLFWIFVVIFSATAIITLLGITNVIEIKGNFLNALFAALILEVVAAVIIVFQSFDFNEEPAPDLGEIIAEANLTEEMLPRQTAEAFVLSKLKETKNLPQLNNQLQRTSQELDSLMVVLQNCEGQSQKIKEDLDELEKTFYIRIKRLRDLISKYGGVINIAFKESEKVEVYKLMIEIFTELGMVTNNTPIYKNNNPEDIDYEVVKNMYRKFKRDSGDKVKDKQYIYITEFDTILMIRKYLSIIAPVEK